jgi:hypothetical protein
VNRSTYETDAKRKRQTADLHRRAAR